MSIITQSSVVARNLLTGRPGLRQVLDELKILIRHSEVSTRKIKLGRSCDTVLAIVKGPVSAIPAEVAVVPRSVCLPYRPGAMVHPIFRDLNRFTETEAVAADTYDALLEAWYSYSAASVVFGPLGTDAMGGALSAAQSARAMIAGIDFFTATTGVIPKVVIAVEDPRAYRTFTKILWNINSKTARQLAGAPAFDPFKFLGQHASLILY